jgi:DNA invertase Pin-like site-specific DNA recombinase
MSDYKVAYYIRVSIGEQSKGYSLEGQKSILDDWIKETDWKWVKTYYEEASAKDINRQKFQEMIADATHGLFDGICIVDSDRFSRSTKDLLKIMDDLVRYKVKLHIHNLQHIDIYSEQGRLLLTNLATYSEFFRMQLSAKIRTGVKQKMKNEWFGQAPYGYTIISDVVGNRKKHTRLVENPEEQIILKRMKKLRDSRKSYSEIAIILNKENIPTRYTNKNKKSSWHPSTIRNILIRPEVKMYTRK